MKPPPAVRIRDADDRDAEAIASVIRQSFLTHPARHIPAEMPLYHAEHHLERMLDPDTRWALLEDQGRPAGIAMWRLLPDMAHLHLLFVAGPFQRRGYGVRLLRHHQECALDEHPATRLFTLHCLRDSQWAMRFYAHHGYTLYDTGDEGRVTDLVLWIDACRRHDNGWPLKSDKALFYRPAHR